MQVPGVGAHKCDMYCERFTAVCKQSIYDPQYYKDFKPESNGPKVSEYFNAHSSPASLDQFKLVRGDRGEKRKSAQITPHSGNVTQSTAGKMQETTPTPTENRHETRKPNYPETEGAYSCPLVLLIPQPCHVDSLMRLCVRDRQVSIRTTATLGPTHVPNQRCLTLRKLELKKIEEQPLSVANPSQPLSSHQRCSLRTSERELPRKSVKQHKSKR